MIKTDRTTDIPVSSLTYAIKGQKVLERQGFSAWAGRDHDRVTGCGYKITVRAEGSNAQRARQILIENGIKLARRSPDSKKEGGRR